MVFWEDYGVSDEVLGTFAPIAVYWLYSGMYHFIIPPFEKYRLHSFEDEKRKNLVTVPQVVRGVLFQQAIQVVVALLLFTVLIFLLKPNSNPADAALFVDDDFSGVPDRSF